MYVESGYLAARGERTRVPGGRQTAESDDVPFRDGHEHIAGGRFDVGAPRSDTRGGVDLIEHGRRQKRVIRRSLCTRMYRGDRLRVGDRRQTHL